MSEPANVDADEIAKFSALAHRWWDTEGEFKPLHDTNPLRTNYIVERAGVEGLRILDVGCGGGILTESLAALGAEVVGIDMGEAPLSVAKLRGIETGTNVTYLQQTAEQHLAETGETYDVVCCLEMLEHVPDFRSTVAALADLTKPGGNVFLSTINRTPAAYALLIVGAEYITNILPRGTHDYEKFIKPSELSAAVRAADLNVTSIDGMRYNPLTRHASLTRNTMANYLLHAQKDP